MKQLTRAFRAALAAAAILGLASCGSGGGGGNNDKGSGLGPIAKAFWGHWNDPTGPNGGYEWYMNDSTITSPYGSLTVQEAGATYLVAYSGSLQYRLAVAGTDLLRVTGSAKAFIYKRNGADASITASVVSSSSARILGPAAGVSLVLQNTLNSANVAQAVSQNQTGALTVTGSIIAGDSYAVSLTGATQPFTTLHVSSPGENVGTLAIAPASLGYTFKLASALGPADIYYAGDTATMYLFIKNTGSKDASGLSFSLASTGLTLAGAGGYKLTGSGVTIAKGSQVVTQVSASLNAGTNFAGADYVEPTITATISAGGETWVDSVPVRFYREARYVRIDTAAEGSCPIYGYFMSPEKVALGFSASSSEDYVDVKLPYRSTPYDAYLFPDPNSDYMKNTGEIVYGALVSSSAAVPTGTVPIKATNAQYGIYYRKSSSGNSYYSVEDWCYYMNRSTSVNETATSFNDGAEPNNSIGTGPTAYAGGSFHGVLDSSDVDAFTIDFSQADPYGADSDTTNDFELHYSGVIDDKHGPSGYTVSGDGDEVIDPGESLVAVFDLRCHLDPSTIDSTLHAYLSTSGASVLPYKLDGSTLKQLFFYDGVYTPNRSVGIYLSVPAGYAAANLEVTLTVASSNASGTTPYGTYTCEVPIGAAR